MTSKKTMADTVLIQSQLFHKHLVLISEPSLEFKASFQTDWSDPHGPWSLWYNLSSKCKYDLETKPVSLNSFKIRSIHFN